MTLTSILELGNNPAPTRRPSGRPRIAADPVQRALHVRVAEACLLYGWTRKKAAIRFEISLRSAKAWVKAAPGYPEGRHLLPFVRRAD